MEGKEEDVRLSLSWAPCVPSKEQVLSKHILNKCMNEERNEHLNNWILISPRTKAKVFTGAFKALQSDAQQVTLLSAC